MKIIKSSKRTYQIFLNEKSFRKTQEHLETLSLVGLQDYIDFCFSKSSKLGSSSKSGAWTEGKNWRDKGKMGVVEKENRVYATT